MISTMRSMPISAQYSDGADVVYYGEHAHGDFTKSNDLSGTLADQILRYVFGQRIDVSVPSKSGTFEHEPDGCRLSKNWEDSYGSTWSATG